MKWIFAILMILAPSLSLAEIIPITIQNSIVFQDDIDLPKIDVALTAITAKYSALPKNELLYVFIFSPGGSVDAAKMMSDYLNTLPKIRLVCMDCESAAGWLFENAIQPRLILKRSRIMMHEIRLFVVTPSIMHEINPTEFYAAADAFNAIFATRMHMTPKAYADRISGTEWYVSGNDMMTTNLADQVIEVACDTFTSMLMPNTCANAVK